MKTLKQLHWPLIIGLGVLALVRPLIRIVADRVGVTEGPVVPVLITVAISLVWVLAVGLTRVQHPVPTLVAVGMTYAVLSILLSGILSPLLTGELQGPLAQPSAIIPVLVVNVLWGLAAGALALLVRRLRSRRSAVTEVH